MRSRIVDTFAVVALFVFGVAIRRHVLPRDGLLFDDAWVVLGVKGRLSNALSVTTLQPGFTVLLKPWRALVSGRTQLMPFPGLVVGASSGAVLYLVLRRWSVTRPVAFAVSLVLVDAPVAVIYSGRVKPYVFEIVIVIALAATLPALAARRWNWLLVALWACGSVVLASFSAYTVPAVVGAGLVLALHPDRDAVKRCSAVALQFVATAVYLRQVDSSFDATGTNRGWEQTWNAYIEVQSPLRMAREITTHVARLGEVVLRIPGVVGFAVVVAAILGLVLDSRAGQRRISARFLLLLLVIAFVGGLTHQIPFGPTAGGNPDVYPGSRASLWLLPSLVTGLAFALDRVARGIRRISVPAGTGVALLIVASAGIVVGVNSRDVPLYPLIGARSTHEYVLKRAGPHDVVVMLANAVWNYAPEPRVPVIMHIDARLLNGFSPVLTDPRIWSTCSPPPCIGRETGLRDHIANTHHVLIIDGNVGWFDREFPKVKATLGSLGFRRVNRENVGTFALEEWTRGTR